MKSSMQSAHLTSAPDRNQGGYDPDFYEELHAAEDKHFWFRARNRVVASLASEFVKDLPSPYYVLEFGCGGGNVTKNLQDTCTGGTVIGADLFADGLPYARKRGVNLLVQADIAKFPFRCGFDLVGIFDVLEHIPDDAGTLRSLYEALRPGGLLLITVPAHQSLWSYFDEAAHHCRRYELAELRARCEAAGLEVEYATEFMTSIYPIVRLQRWWAGKKQQSSGISSQDLVKKELAIHPVLNTVLHWLTRMETSRILRRKQLPFGTSILAVARKKS